MKRFLLILASVLTLASCVREWIPEEAVREDGLVERTWTVAMHDGTRATLDGDLHPVWEVGERLSVYDHVAKVGRVFEVVSVDGNKATISGTISPGDFPFDAIYPSKSAGAWSADGTNTLKLPATQLIPAGRNVCPDVLVSTAHSDSPDGVIAFHNISSLLKVKIERDGIAQVSLTLTGSQASDVHGYQAAAETGTLAPGTYYIAVDPGTYAGGLSVSCSEAFGVEYQKSSSTPLEAAPGGILNLGTVSDGTLRRYYKINSQKNYSNLTALLNETGLVANIDPTVLNLLLMLYFPDKSKPVRAISYTYRSVDPQGNPVDLSALLYVPAAALSGTKLTGIALANHGTIAANAECPTMKAQFEGAFVGKNYAVVMPDYYGFGVSKAHPQAYLNAETTARGNIDAYLCAVQLLTDNAVTLPAKKYNIGYSQGGFNAMANLRYVSQHPELGISFTKTFCGGSPFDVPTTWESYLSTPLANAVKFVPLTLVSFNETQQLGIDYSHLFKEPLLSHVQDWILSKQYNTAQIQAKIGSDSLSDVLTAEMLSGTGADYASIMEVCHRFSLTSGWAAPASGSWIYIYHSSQDDSVPYANYTAMKNYLNAVAPGANITWQSGADGDHVNGCIAFIKNILMNNYW